MTHLLQNAAYGTALILAAAVLRRTLRDRLVPEARLALWAVCLFRLLTPAAPESALSLWGLLNRPAPAAVQASRPYLSGPALNAPAASQAQPGGFSWSTTLGLAWLAVGLLLAVRYGLAWARTRRAVGCAILLGRDDPRYAPLPKCARLREGPMEGAPLTFGALRPTVVLSPGLEGERLACVLAHEGVHARRRDNLWHYAMALALVVHWWNPAVWLMARLLRRDIELSCDRAAVKKLGTERRADYARALVSLATQGEGPAFSHPFGRKLTEERIRSIMKFKKTSVIGGILSLALVLALTVAFASEPVEPEYDYVEDGNPMNGNVLASGGPVRTSSGLYDLCKDQACKVSYDHCHIDGEVVRVYYENPGLLCAHPDCEIEGPHEHDGTQYAGKAGKYVILEPDTAPVPSSTPDGVSVSASVDVSRNSVIVLPDTVIYHGRTYNRADLSAETLEWLDWYLSLPEEEQLAVSYEPAELRDSAKTICYDYRPDPVLMSLDEYAALLDGLVSQGKMSQEDADWFLDGATRGMKSERNRLYVTEDGSYAIM